MKTDLKPRVKIVRIYTHYNSPTYDVQLVTTGVVSTSIGLSVCLLVLKHLVSLQGRVRPSVQVVVDLLDLVPVDGDYYHFRRLLVSNWIQ